MGGANHNTGEHIQLLPCNGMNVDSHVKQSPVDRPCYEEACPVQHSPDFVQCCMLAFATACRGRLLGLNCTLQSRLLHLGMVRHQDDKTVKSLSMVPCEV